MSSIDLPVPVQRFDRPIVLVGLMGVGKTTVGRRLANLLGRSFVDADEAIEEAARSALRSALRRQGKARAPLLGGVEMG